MFRRLLVSPGTYAGLLSLLLAGALVYGAREYITLQDAYAAEKHNTAILEYNVGELSEKFEAANVLIEDLKALLAVRQSEKSQLGEQVQTLSSTVVELDKLTKTDKQLLQKYSSVYFLNENYEPVATAPIDEAYLARPERQEYFLTSAMHHLKDLMDAARAAGIPLSVLSGYRSFETQAALKEGYKMTYGAGTANSFSADQGYSEHQLATTVDFTVPQLNLKLAGFDKTPAFPWLNEHAHEYGFILSYPKNNGHFIFEPWHWRYVGVALATKLHAEGKSFYDLDQREIDTYILQFSD